MSDHDTFMQAAIDEAKKGLAAGGIPIGSVLVLDGKIIGRGHNQRVQQGSAIRHAEMDCLENTGRLPASDYRRAVLYSTLSPCDMCSGAALLYGITHVVVGENRTFQGPESYVKPLFGINPSFGTKISGFNPCAEQWVSITAPQLLQLPQ